MKDRIQKNIDIPKTIYIKTDYLKQYIDTILDINTDFILISGSSDYSPQINFKAEYEKIIMMPNLIKWYAENNLSDHEKMHSLTIGFATHTREYEDSLLHIRNTICVTENKVDAIFCCWRYRDFNVCGNEFIERTSMTNFVYDNPVLFHTYPSNMNILDYQSTIAKYKWCLCPLGNGVDCAPKIVECFFLKTIPIVRRNSHLLRLYGRYPVVWVDDFKEVLDMKLVYDDKIEWDRIIDEFKCEYWINKILN
jgi:hypothetical protein